MRNWSTPPGITFADGLYRVRLYVKRKTYHGGYFKTLDAAIRKRKQMENSIHIYTGPSYADSVISKFLSMKLPSFKMDGERGNHAT